jgi:hypothetical protein
MAAPRIPILTWHAQRVDGNDYASNDHVAFAHDLETIHRMGLRVVSLREIAEALVQRRLDRLHGCVGLSIDDGTDFDFHDLPHPTWGAQRSILRILEDFRARHGAEAQPALHVTSFAVVSPEARAQLDRTCMIGCKWWNDDWWAEAENTGLMAVESHGWDHNHASLDHTETTAERGTFDVRDAGEAEREIGNAAVVLREKRGRGGAVLFAYPYGPANDFLAEGWLPRNAARLGVVAAFAGDQDSGPVTSSASRWRIPRYVFGGHWKAEGELEKLLRDAGATPYRRRWFSHWVGGRPKQPAVVERPKQWREHLRTWEVNDARVVAGELFKRSFGHDVPAYPRHFVLVYSPPPDDKETQPKVVAYVHQRPYEDVYLGGGMCVDAVSYRRMPRWLFDQVRDEGGLATIVTRDSIAMLGDSPAAFGHVGEPRARQADLRTGYVDTGVEHLMVYWRKPLHEDEKRQIIEKVAAVGAF